MAFSSGTFTRLYDWTDDAANGVKIRADRMDAEFDGIATALSTCITKDGQTTVTANIPFNGYRLTGVGDPSGAQDGATKNYVDTTALLLAGTQTVTGNKTFSGTVTISGTFTMPNDTVTNAKLANMAEATVKGRADGAGTGDPVDLTATQLLTIIKTVDGASSGLDADLLDGQSSAYYLNASNMNAGALPEAQLPVAAATTGKWGFAGGFNVSGGRGFFGAPGDDSANPASANVAGIAANVTGILAASADGAAAILLNRMTSNGETISFRRGGTLVGTVSVDGSSTTYNTSSDYRLKENVTDLTGSGDFIDALRPVSYTKIADGAGAQGFLAHEFALVCPEAVQGEKDGPVMQSMMASHPRVIANIIAELQALRDREAALEDRILALENA